MKFRFIGEYTNKHTSINAGGVVFVGNEPSEVECPELIRRLSANIEFEAVGEVVEAVEAPVRKRRRPKKNADPVEG